MASIGVQWHAGQSRRHFVNDWCIHKFSAIFFSSLHYRSIRASVTASLSSPFFPQLDLSQIYSNNEAVEIKLKKRGRSMAWLPSAKEIDRFLDFSLAAWTASEWEASGGYVIDFIIMNLLCVIRSCYCFFFLIIDSFKIYYWWIYCLLFVDLLCIVDEFVIYSVVMNVLYIYFWWIYYIFIID